MRVPPCFDFRPAKETKDKIADDIVFGHLPTPPSMEWESDLSHLLTDLVNGYGFQEAMWRNRPQTVIDSVAGKEINNFIKSLLQEKDVEIARAKEEMREIYIPAVQEAKEMGKSEGYREGIEKAIELIDEYFEGLIMIPAPELTKESIKEKLDALKQLK